MNNLARAIIYASGADRMLAARAIAEAQRERSRAAELDALLAKTQAEVMRLEQENAAMTRKAGDNVGEAR